MPKIPEYFMNYIDSQNQIFENYRLAYKKAQNELYFYIIKPENIQFEKQTFEPQDINLDQKSLKLRYSFSDKFQDILQRISQGFQIPIEKLSLIEVIEQINNKLLHFRTKIDYNQKDLTLEQLKFEHYSV